MKIGIDLDGVVFDFEKGLIASSEIFDIEKCRANGEVHLGQFCIQDRYDWTNEEKEQFIKENFIEVSKRTPIMAGAKYVLDELKKMGHELIIISARGLEANEMIEIVMEKFKEVHLTFDKYYWKECNKLAVCKREKIDVMIDDRPSICEKMVENKIRTLYFKGIRGWDLEESDYLVEVDNWGAVYRYIRNWSEK